VKQMAKTERAIYHFIKKKLKERNIRVHEFHGMCGFSKATLYRIMTGSQMPTEAQQAKIIELLDFDEYEIDTFSECIKELEFDDNQLKAFEIIDSIFSDYAEPSKQEPQEFIVWDGNKSIKTYDEVLDMIRRAANKEGFFCEMRIYSCVHGGALEPISDLLEELRGKQIIVQHYTKFYDNDDLENVLAFRASIQLLRHSRWSKTENHTSGRETHWR